MVISNNLVLKSVLHVPNLSCNLLSISKLTSDCNCSVQFFDRHCVFQDLQSGRAIGNAKLVDGLYYFDDATIKTRQGQVASNGVISTSITNQIMLWHYRLGHPSFAYLKLLFPALFKNLNPINFQCEVC